MYNLNPQSEETETNNDINHLRALHFWSIARQFSKEHLAFWMICAYLFVEYVRPQSIYPSLDVLPFAKLFLGLAAIGAIADRSVQWVSHPISKLITLFLVLVILAIVTANYPNDAAEHFMDFFGWFVIYFCVINIVNSERRLIIFLLIFLLASFKISASLARVFASRGFSFTTWGLSGPPGFFENSGELAIQMLVYWPMAYFLAQSLRPHLSLPKYVFLMAMPVTAIATIIGASSRGGQLALVVQLIALLFVNRIRLWRLILVFAAVGLVYIAIPDEGIARFQQAGQDNTSQQRLVYWKRGLEMVAEHPFLGVGFFNFEHYFQDYFPQDLLGTTAQLPHNIFIQVATDGGIPLLATLLALVFTAYKTAVKVRNTVATESSYGIYAPLSHGLNLSLLGFLVAGQFVTVTYYPFLWIHLSFVVCLHNIAIKQSKVPPQIR